MRSSLSVLFAVAVASSTLLRAGEGAGGLPEAPPVERFKTLPGFKVERLYSVPAPTQGSWVALTVDHKKRLIAGDQYGGLFRITVPALGSAAGLNVEELKVDFKTLDAAQAPAPAGKKGKGAPPEDRIGAHGLLYAFDSLYVVRTEKNPGLYRLQDKNGDDQFEVVEKLGALPQRGGEHGPHQVALSPDGKTLAVFAGNYTAPVETALTTVPKLWSEDHILPRMWDANGHAKGILAPGGVCYNVSPDGKTWEIRSTGYRNHYDGAFNRNGDLFTYDSDMEWDMNTPWYRPTRVVMACSGSEYGWRSGSGVWPTYYIDSLPPVVNIGPGSPTGVTFGYGAKFPKKYQDALFAADWSFGKLYAVHLTPSGASYSATFEPFLQGTPLPLTDLVVHPDGAMYFAVGGRRVQSGLYRITYTGNEPVDPAPAAPNLTPEMKLRRELEAFHGKAHPDAVKTAWPALRHPDRFVRFAARVALEFNDPATWQAQALSESDPQAAFTALTALARVKTGSKELLPQVLGALQKFDLAKLPQPLQLDLLRTYQLAFLRLGLPEGELREKAIATFDPLLPAATRELNIELLQMLIALEAPSAAAKGVALLEKAPGQEEQLDYARALRVLKGGWNNKLRETYFAWFNKAANYRGGNSFRGFVNNIKNEALALLDDAAKKELKPITEAKVEVKSPVEAAKALLAGRTTSKEWTVAELAPKLESGLKQARNLDRGRQMFAATACYTCHRYGDEGGALGPDLTSVAGRFSPRDLLEAIIEPSKAISDQYGMMVITQKDGKRVTGRVVNLSGDGMRVNTDISDPNALTQVKQADVQSVEPSKLSPMPEGLLAQLTEEEILDLLAFLLAGRGNP